MKAPVVVSHGIQVGFESAFGVKAADGEDK